MKSRPLSSGERVILFSDKPLQGILADLPKGWESHVLGWKLPMGWMKGRMGWELWRRPVNLYFVPGQGLPWKFPTWKKPKTKFVTTIHDIGFKRIPEKYDPVVRRRLEHVTKDAIKKSALLLTVSAFTKQEVQEVYAVPSSRLVATPLSAKTQDFLLPTMEQVQKTLQKYRLGHQYFFFVGRLEHKKNLLLLLQAFDTFKQRRGLGDPFELVLAGNPGYGGEEIKQYAESLPSAESIRFLGYVPEEEVMALFSEATAFVFPSWYEGFGIPNLEAMLCHTALITSAIPVHKEVAGEAALFLSPEKVEAWAEGLQRMVDEEGLKEQLIEKGIERVKQFSWKATAEKTWDALSSCLF